MIQFIISRANDTSLTASRIGDAFGIKWVLVDKSYEKSWNTYATKIIDALTLWCKTCGIKEKEFATGYTQIAIQITFLNAKDAVLFKLRWHDA